MVQLKNIWIFNHYANDMFDDHGGRHYYIAKNLIQQGYSPTIFCCNARHHGYGLYIDNNNLWNVKFDTLNNIPFVFIRGRKYRHNGFQRILCMMDYYFNLKKVVREYEEKYGKPDIIYASSVHPLACVAGIQIAKKYGIKCICEIRDLWPESIVSYGLAPKWHPLVLLLRRIEKWIYKNCDYLIFTMLGGYEYIIDQGWEKDIPENKVHYIPNGVDLDVYNKNKILNSFPDKDLDDVTTYKIIYTGSLRHANHQIWDLIYTAEHMKEKYRDIKFFIYGDGTERESLEKYCKDKNIENIIFKGKIPKEKVPYVLSKCNLNIIDVKTSDILKYGGSQNKLFEYLASGHPSLSGEQPKYSLINKYNCGICRELHNCDEIENAILEIRTKEFKEEHIIDISQKFDFKVLTKQLIDII